MFINREEVNAGSKTVYIFALSVAFMFLFLAALYESWFGAVFGIAGCAYWRLWAILTLTYMKSLLNNGYAQVGLITIVEFAKERVDHGHGIYAGSGKASFTAYTHDFPGIYIGRIATGVCQRCRR